MTPGGKSDNKSMVRSASVAAATKTITAAAAALSELPSSPAPRRHIHRRSIVGKGTDSFTHSPVASFHSRRSSCKYSNVNYISSYLYVEKTTLIFYNRAVCKKDNSEISLMV